MQQLHTKFRINKLQMVQKRAACFICKDYRRLSSVTGMLNSLDMKQISGVHQNEIVNDIQDYTQISGTTRTQLHHELYQIRYTRK